MVFARFIINKIKTLEYIILNVFNKMFKKEFTPLKEQFNVLNRMLDFYLKAVHQIKVKRILKKRHRFRLKTEKQQFKQIIKNIPEIKDSQTILYIGARADSFQIKEYMQKLDLKITILEIFHPNVVFLRNKGFEVIEADITKYKTERQWDIILWWHGPEHIEKSEIFEVLKNLEKIESKAVILGCPWGLHPQNTIYNNIHEIHKCTLYEEDFKSLDYNTRTLGKMDGDYSNLLA